MLSNFFSGCTGSGRRRHKASPSKIFKKVRETDELTSGVMLAQFIDENLTTDQPLTISVATSSQNGSLDKKESVKDVVVAQWTHPSPRLDSPVIIKLTRESRVRPVINVYETIHDFQDGACAIIRRHDIVGDAIIETYPTTPETYDGKKAQERWLRMNKQGTGSSIKKEKKAKTPRFENSEFVRKVQARPLPPSPRYSNVEIKQETMSPSSARYNVAIKEEAMSPVPARPIKSEAIKARCLKLRGQTKNASVGKEKIEDYLTPIDYERREGFAKKVYERNSSIDTTKKGNEYVKWPLAVNPTYSVYHILSRARGWENFPMAPERPIKREVIEAEYLIMLGQTENTSDTDKKCGADANPAPTDYERNDKEAAPESATPKMLNLDNSDWKRPKSPIWTTPRKLSKNASSVGTSLEQACASGEIENSPEFIDDGKGAADVTPPNGIKTEDIVTVSSIENDKPIGVSLPSFASPKETTHKRMFGFQPIISDDSEWDKIILPPRHDISFSGFRNEDTDQNSIIRATLQQSVDKPCSLFIEENEEADSKLVATPPMETDPKTITSQLLDKSMSGASDKVKLIFQRKVKRHTLPTILEENQLNNLPRPPHAVISLSSSISRIPVASPWKLRHNPRVRKLTD